MAPLVHLVVHLNGDEAKKIAARRCSFHYFFVYFNRIARRLEANSGEFRMSFKAISSFFSILEVDIFQCQLQKKEISQFFFFRSKLFIWVALPPPLPAVETRRGGFPSRTDLENNLIFDLLRVGRCLPDVDFCPASHLPVYRLAPSFLAPPVSIFRSIRTVAISQVHVSSFFFSSSTFNLVY